MKNIVITGVQYRKIFDEVKADLVLACPEVLVKDISISYAAVGYHRSDVKPRKSDVVGCSFRSGQYKLNIFATRYTSEVKELWQETGQANPEFLLIHCINLDNSSMVAPDDRPYMIIQHLLAPEPKAILFAIAGNEGIANNVSNYIDININNEYGKYGGLVSKVYYNDNEVFRTSFNELVARGINGSVGTRYAPGVYPLIDEILDLEEVTCTKLSNPNIRPRPRQPARTMRNDRIDSGSAVDYGFSNTWRSYSGNHFGQGNPLYQRLERDNKQRPVSEVVNKVLDTWKPKSSIDYYYSSSSSNQSLDHQNDNGYHTLASNASHIQDVSDTDLSSISMY